MRRLALVGALVAAIVWWRRRARSEYAEVAFDDGSAVRLDRGMEAEDLLDDARELLRTLAP